MSDIAQVPQDEAAPPQRREIWPASLIIGLIIAFGWLAASLLWPILGTTDPNGIDLANRLAAPGAGHLFGTDHLGRDVLTRVMHAARIDIWMGVMGVVPPLIIGVFIGIVSGYFGGFIDSALMRLVDVTLAFPFFVLVLAIVAMLGPGLTNYFIALALVGWVAYARIVRAQVQVMRNAEFILAARTLGFGHAHILFRHVLPNTISTIAVYAMTDIVLVILAGASLGFLGLGVKPPMAEWGAMIADGQPYVLNAWWICLFPGLAAMSLGLGFSLIGDGLARLLQVNQG